MPLKPRPFGGATDSAGNVKLAYRTPFTLRYVGNMHRCGVPAAALSWDGFDNETAWALVLLVRLSQLHQSPHLTLRDKVEQASENERMLRSGLQDPEMFGLSMTHEFIAANDLIPRTAQFFCLQYAHDRAEYDALTSEFDIR